MSKTENEAGDVGRLVDSLYVNKYTSVEIEWSGSGDSGGMESAFAYRKLVQQELPPGLRQQYYDRLYNLVHVPGLEINEGGFWLATVTRRGIHVLWGNNVQRTIDPSFAGVDIDPSRSAEEQSEVFQPLLAALRQEGIQEVDVNWYGGGDSGGLEYIGFTPKKPSEALRQLVEDFFTDGYPGLPQCEHNNDGGAWSAHIDVDAGILTFPSAVDYEMYTERHTYSIAPGLDQPEQKRCEKCFRFFGRCGGGEADCESKAKLAQQVRTHAYVGRDKLVPYEEAEDLWLALNEDKREILHKIYGKLRAGQTAWTIEELGHGAGYFKEVILLREALDQYPYRSAKALRENKTKKETP